jgi:hypothetical protein
MAVGGSLRLDAVCGRHTRIRLTAPARADNNYNHSMHERETLGYFNIGLASVVLALPCVKDRLSFEMYW